MMMDDGDGGTDKNLKSENSQDKNQFYRHLNIVESSHFNFNYVYGTILWLSFFLPLTERYYIENAFNLSYIGVNSLCLYAALSMFVILSWPIYYFIWRWKNPNDVSSLFSNCKIGMIISLVFAQLGASVKLFSFFNYKDSGLFVLFAIGQIILVVGVVTYFIIS